MTEQIIEIDDKDKIKRKKIENVKDSKKLIFIDSNEKKMIYFNKNANKNS